MGKFDKYCVGQFDLKMVFLFFGRGREGVVFKTIRRFEVVAQPRSFANLNLFYAIFSFNDDTALLCLCFGTKFS